jgi:hypothetical protein
MSSPADKDDSSIRIRGRATSVAGAWHVCTLPRVATWDAATRARRDRFRYFANSLERSAKALNSSALPEGSSRNIVACSPGWP